MPSSDSQTSPQATPEQDLTRRQEARRVEVQAALAKLADEFNHATRTQPPRETSGLVEMQRIFAKLRK